MNDNNQESASINHQTVSPLVQSASTVAISVKQIVEEKLAGTSGVLKDKLVEHLVNEELGRRQTMILNGLAKRKEAANELYKIKPDVVTYNEDKTVKDSAWTKGKLDERTKAQEKLDTWDKALDAGLAEKPNFEKLQKLVG